MNKKHDSNIGLQEMNCQRCVHKDAKFSTEENGMIATTNHARGSEIEDGR
jgi:hypothetical protein